MMWAANVALVSKQLGAVCIIYDFFFLPRRRQCRWLYPVQSWSVLQSYPSVQGNIPEKKKTDINPYAPGKIRLWYGIQFFKTHVKDTLTARFMGPTWGPDGCRQAPSHYQSQCWSRTMPPYGITRPQRVKISRLDKMADILQATFFFKSILLIFLIKIHRSLLRTVQLTKPSTVRCRYNAINFLPHPHNRRSIVHPGGRVMGCLLWARNLIEVLLLLLHCYK